MPKTKKKDAPGQKLWLSLYHADLYDQETERIVVASVPRKLNPEHATRRWLKGMSRHLKEDFATGLRRRREELGLAQRELAEIAGLTVTAVAMIERGERAPNLDTAARLCWALDMAAGTTLPETT